MVLRRYHSIQQADGIEAITKRVSSRWLVYSWWTCPVESHFVMRLAVKGLGDRLPGFREFVYEVHRA